MLYRIPCSSSLAETTCGTTLIGLEYRKERRFALPNHGAEMTYFRMLDDFKLSDPNTLDTRIQQLDSAAIDNLRQRIDEYYKKNLSKIVTDVQQSEGVNLYCSRDPAFSKHNLQFLRAACLYSDKLIIWDGLHGFLSGLQAQIPLEFSKIQLAYHIKHLLVMRDLAEYGLLVLIPYSLYSQEVWKQVDQRALADANCNGFREICFSNMEIWVDDILTKEGQKCGMRRVVLGHNLPSYFNVIYTGVPSQCSVDVKPGPPFMLHTPTDSYQFKLRKTSLQAIDNDVDIKQSVDQVIHSAAHDVNIDLLSSEYLNGRYFTDFDVHWELVHWKLVQQTEKDKERDRLKSSVPIQLLMDWRFLDEIPLVKILEIRDKEEGPFREFRQALNKTCKNIERISPSEKLKDEIKIVQEENIRPELNRLDEEFDKLRKLGLVNGLTGVISIGSIIASAVIGNPLALGGLASAAASIIKHKIEVDAIKRNSMYFLWKIKK